MEGKTVIESMYDVFVEKGMEVYYPTQKIGECESEYVVVKKDGGTAHSFASSNIDHYSVLCYVPQARYGDIEKLVMKAKVVMNNLFPLLTQLGSETPSFYDETIKAHMVTIFYKNYKFIDLYETEV